MNQGGNAFGTDPAEEMARFQRAGVPVWLPLIDRADDDGSDLQFRIVNFVCVLLDPIDNSGASDWTGVILNPQVDSRCNKGGGLRRGGEDPAPNLMPVFTYALVE